MSLFYAVSLKIFFVGVDIYMDGYFLLAHWRYHQLSALFHCSSELSSLGLWCGIFWANYSYIYVAVLV